MLNYAARFLALSSLLSLLLSGCSRYEPPYNNFKPYNRMPKNTVKAAGIGLVAGAVASPVTPVLIPGGAVIGGATGMLISRYKDSRRGIVRELSTQDIQYVEYGDTASLIIPTDRYFMFSSARLNEVCYPGLVNIIKLLKTYPKTPVYVAGFTDNVGSRHHKNNLSQAQAETMLTFLWANGIHAQRLAAEGYGDKHPIADNKLIHGSAQNRRLEIQWLRCPPIPVTPLAMTK